MTFAVVSLGVLSVAGNSPKSVFAQQRFDVGDGGSTKGTEFKQPKDAEEGDTFNYKFMVPIPQPEAGGGPVKEVGGDTGIADYINILYLFGLGIGGVLAFVALVYGGFLWTVSGAVGKKSQAKSIIGNALLGLAILATSYIILHTVNPDLVGPLKAEKQSHEITLSGESCPVFSKESKEKAAQCCQDIKSSGDCSSYVLEGSGLSLGSWQWACRQDECDVCGEEDSLQGLVEHTASGRCKPQLSPDGGWECVAASDPICPNNEVHKEYSVP
ncbi:MAG TPA: pilin, partial [Patescibacteria group bacterium]|nr:pilin [Patescibacteria group bacterium]